MALEVGSDGPAWAGAPLLSTKVTPPLAAPALVPRPRLTGRLRPNPRTRAAVLVAPAGSGKSSVISQWSRDEGSVAWLSLDAEDSDPARFLLYVAAALERVQPEAAAPVRELLQSPQRASLDHALAILLNALAELSRTVTLVLDDYHRLRGPEVHQVLDFLLAHQPATLFLIISSREDLPLPLSRLRLSGELIELRGSDLRFSAEEAARFFADVMSLELEPQAAAQLAERTEGWIAGLQLAALSLQGHPQPDEFVDAFTGSNRYLVDYLAEEVLRRQEPDVQSFLRRTAILERLCAPLCEAVTGAPRGQARLEGLEAANLFLIPLDGERRWYRYHHLFSDVLKAWLLADESEDPAELHRRAGEWFASAGAVHEAVEHALAGGHAELAARFIEGHYQGMWHRGEWRILERWLHALPCELVRSRPHLALAWAGIDHYYWRPGHVETLLSALSFDPPDTAENRDLRGRSASALAWAARARGDCARAAVLARQALELLEPASHTFRGSALLSLSVVEEEGGNLPEAERLCREAAAEAEAMGHANFRLRVSYGCGQLAEARGALREAEEIHRASLDYERRTGLLPQPYGALVLAGLGRIAFQRNDVAAAVEYVEAGLARCHSSFSDPQPVHAFACCFEMWRIRTAQGDHAAAEELLERMESSARALRSAFLKPALALLRVRRPDAPAPEAAAWLAEFEGRAAGGGLPRVLVPDHCLPDLRSREIITWARLRLTSHPAEDGRQAVEARLERFLDAMLTQGRNGSALELRLFLAGLHWQAGRQERALAVLAPAVALAAKEGCVRVFVEAGPALAAPLRQAAAQGAAPEFVGTLLSALGTASRAAAAPAAVLAEPLSEREMEVLRLAAAGLSNGDIASQLFVSVGTVKQHLHHINEKLDTTSRTAAVARATALKLL